MVNLLDLSTVFKEACSFCDWDDRETLAALRTINESEQRSISYAVAEKLYDNVAGKAKLANLDFTEITKTKGDITKLDGFDELNETINILDNAQSKLHLKGKAINVVATAMNNLMAKRSIFKSAFRTGNSILMDTYKFGAMAVIASTSLITISLTDYFIAPDHSASVSINIVNKKRLFKQDTREYTLLDQSPLIINLEKFNNMCETNGLEEVEKALAKVKRSNFGGVEIAAGAVVAVIVLYNLVDILRELVYYFLFAKASVSEYFYANSVALEINANKIKGTNKDAADTQVSFANSFRHIAEKLKVDDKEAVSKSAKALKHDNMEIKYKAEDLSDALPDSSASDSSGLF